MAISNSYSYKNALIFKDLYISYSRYNIWVQLMLSCTQIISTHYIICNNFIILSNQKNSRCDL